MNDIALDEVLGADGPFARAIKQFSVRPTQQAMALAVEEALIEKQTLIAESGTGTGKTFAYLVPLLLSNKKSIVSTGTKHLQEQLFHRDIPAVLKVLKLNADIALLKGRANYLCLQRMQQTRLTIKRAEKPLLEDMQNLQAWLPTTRSGDIAENHGVAEDSRIWPQVTSTIDNCLGQECSFYDDCFVNHARKRAQAADVVVINHHLYFADQALKEDGFGALLPEVDAYVFDEAHQLPDIASNFLGRSFSSRQVLELCTDVRNAELKERSSIKDLSLQADLLARQVADQRLALGIPERRLSWIDLCEELPAFNNKLQKLTDNLQAFADILERAASAGESLTRCYERSLDLLEQCQAMVANNGECDTQIRWVEISKKTYRIHETPLDIGQALSDFFDNQKQARIFTSATLSVNGDFSHFRASAGISEEADEARWDSPFDYFNQAVLYVPDGLPDPRSDEFSDAMYNQILPLLHASVGRTFVLFTSFRVMQKIAKHLQSENFNVLVQGDMNKRSLIKEFVESSNSVLLGTMSFWEGVDVPGDALRCVIIDKLPFESPFEPVHKARLAAIEQAGGNPFISYQVPRAITTLRQGAGRLIRDVQDRGLLMICDSRLRTTRYGKLFLDSLPDMRRTDDKTKAVAFLEHLAAGD